MKIRMNNIDKNKPQSFNGWLTVKKYRKTGDCIHVDTYRKKTSCLVDEALTKLDNDGVKKRLGAKTGIITGTEYNFFTRLERIIRRVIKKDKDLVQTGEQKMLANAPHDRILAYGNPNAHLDGGFVAQLEY